MNEDELVEIAEGTHNARSTDFGRGKFDRDGEADGHWQHFFQTGELRAEGDYVGARKTGLWKAWNRDGSLKSEGVFVDGEMTGEWTFYWPARGVHSRGDLVRGVRHGRLQQFDEAGVKVVDGEYRDGVEHGLWTFWKADGSRWGTATYDRGVLVSRDPEAAD